MTFTSLNHDYIEWALEKSYDLDKKTCVYLLNALAKYGNTSVNKNPKKYLNWLSSVGLGCYVWKIDDGNKKHHYLLEVKNGYGC